MTDWSISQHLAISAPADVIWSHVATAARYSTWACPGADHYEVLFEPRAGSQYTEHYRHGDREYKVTGSVLTFEPLRRVAFHRATPGSAFGPADLIGIDVAARGDDTVVTIDHRFDDLPGAQRQHAYEFYAPGWALSLRTLSEHVVGGWVVDRITLDDVDTLLIDVLPGDIDVMTTVAGADALGGRMVGRQPT